MADFKINIGDPETGKTIQRELKDPEASSLIGKKIGDKIDGSAIGLAGYEFELTGGSDYCGFPMRRDVDGTGRKRILAVGGVGIKKKAKGIRQRKTVCGNTVHEKTVQINLKVLKQGKEVLFQKEEKAGKEGKIKEEKKIEKEETPAEKPAEKKHKEKPAEEKSEKTKKEKVGEKA